MNWHESKGGFLATTVESSGSIGQAMNALCTQIKEKIIPANREVLWDYLRVEFWPDSGRVIVFPALISKLTRVEKAGCQVIFIDILNAYERLADSNLDDDAFEVELLREEKRWIGDFLSAAHDAGISGLRIQFWDGDSEEPICDQQT